MKNKNINIKHLVFIIIGLITMQGTQAQHESKNHLEKEEIQLYSQFKSGIAATTEIGLESRFTYSAFSFYQSIGYKVNPWFTIAGATGFNIIPTQTVYGFFGSESTINAFEVPVMVDARINLLNKRKSPFILVATGVKFENTNSSNDQLRARYNITYGIGGLIRLGNKGGIVFHTGHSATHIKEDVFDQRLYVRLGYAF